MKLTILFILMMIFLNGCSANITRLPGLSYSESNSASYIWHQGFAPVRLFDLHDMAVVRRINNVSIDSSKFNATELTPGKHMVFIARLEQDWLQSKYNWDGKLIGLPLTVEEDRLYLPFYDDACDATWVWIEDWGSAKGNGAPTFKYLKGLRPASGVSPNASGEYTVVAGQAPPMECE